jgi:hypothetical protein
VPVDGVPAETDVGFTLKLTTSIGVIVRVAELLLPSFAVIVAVVEDATAVVVMPKVADNAPFGTVTLAGTVTLLESLLRATEMPVEGAFELNTTVPVAGFEPITVVGCMEKLVRTGAVIAKLAETT